MVVHHHTLKIVFKFISDKLKHLINDIRDELEKTKIKNVELISSLNEERKLSEDLKSGLESLHGVNEQIAEQEQLITGKCLVDF
jgi:preprotein translocase subunit Sec63